MLQQKKEKSNGPLRLGGFPRPLAIITVESLAYYVFHVLAPVILSAVLLRVWPGFLEWPPFVKHIVTGFTSETIWQYVLARGGATHGDVATLQALLLHKVDGFPGTLPVELLGLMTGGALAGSFLLWLSHAPLSHTSLDFRVPVYYTGADGAWRRSAKELGAWASPWWAPERVRWVHSHVTMECFLATINSFVTATMVRGLQPKSPAATPLQPLKEVKRFVTGSLVFLGVESFGIRPTLQLGYTSLVAAYHSDLWLLTVHGAGNLAGVLLGWVLFVLCNTNGEGFSCGWQLLGTALRWPLRGLCIFGAQPAQQKLSQVGTAPSSQPAITPSSQSAITSSSQPAAAPSNQPAAAPSNQPAAAPMISSEAPTSEEERPPRPRRAASRKHQRDDDAEGVRRTSSRRSKEPAAAAGEASKKESVAERLRERRAVTRRT